MKDFFINHGFELIVTFSAVIGSYFLWSIKKIAQLEIQKISIFQNQINEKVDEHSASSVKNQEMLTNSVNQAASEIRSLSERVFLIEGYIKGKDHK